MQLTLPQVAEHYRTMRQLVYRGTEQVFSRLGVRLSAISDNAAIEADGWPDIHGVKTWSWQNGIGRYRREPKRFDVAVTVNGRLCALAIGLPTRGKLTLKVHVLEGCPQNNPIKGNSLTVLLFAAQGYARFLGSLDVWINNPVNDRVVAMYQGLGYAPVRDRTGHVTHMTKSAGPTT